MNDTYQIKDTVYTVDGEKIIVIHEPVYTMLADAVGALLRRLTEFSRTYDVETEGFAFYFYGSSEDGKVEIITHFAAS